MKHDGKQSKPDGGDFTHKPFKALKGIKGDLTERKQAPVPASRVESVTAGPPVEDEDLFLQAMQDVKRVGTSAAPAKPASFSVRVEVDEEGNRLFQQALTDVTPIIDEDAEEDSRPRQASNRMRQLKQGIISINLELDLHGLTREEAVQNLDRFIAGAHRRGQRAVLVITGKGNNSEGEPVLRGVVASWLRTGGKTQVVEFAPAPRELGGNGAYVVFLRNDPQEGN